MEKRKRKVYIPPLWLAIACSTLICAFIQLFMNHSVSFSEWMNENIAFGVRWFLAKLTGWIPFSVTELLVLMVPAFFVALILWVILLVKQGHLRFLRVIALFTSILMVVFCLFVFTLSPGYHTESLATKLNLEDEAVSAEQLSNTAMYLQILMENELDKITFLEEDASVMPYDFDELASKLNDAYVKFDETYPELISLLEIHPKNVTVSPLWTYTHIGGMYAFFTGESNINTYFPDYHLPFTMAHEMAHQMGIARENEANFVAFLACMSSDDAYIRYSGCLNLYTYVVNALYKADADSYWNVYNNLDSRVIYELHSYSVFYEPYRETVVSKVSEKVNDTYLEAQGTPGVKSYGLVVDLAVSYFEKNPIR